MAASGLDLAIKAAGGTQSALARAIRKKPQVVSHWVRKIGRVPAEHVPDVEKATGVPRHVLRPDLYRVPPTEAAA